jgi:hypothetical protein
VNVFLTFITRTTLVVALLFVIIAGGVMIVPKFTEKSRLERKRNELLRQIDYKNHEIKVLKDKQQRVKTDPEFVERLLHSHKLAWPGELVFVFEPEPGK